jgi:hypothetical protein
VPEDAEIRHRGGTQNMKRFLVLFLVLGALIAATLGLPTAATAANGATATPFKPAPYQIAGSIWTCSGSHVVLSKPHNSFVKDSETCLVTGDLTGFAPGIYTGNPSGTLGPNNGVFWTSDFNGAQATSWIITILDNFNGTYTALVVAYY